MSRKLVLVVIDGLTPTMLEASLGRRSTPTLNDTRYLECEPVSVERNVAIAHYLCE